MSPKFRPILSLADAEAVLAESGYVTQHEAGKDDTVLFLVGQQPVSLTVGKNFLRLCVPVLELDKGHVSEEKLPALMASLLSSQIVVAPFGFGILPDTEKPGPVVLLATMVLTCFEGDELLEVVHRLPGVLISTEEILQRYAV